MNKMIAALAFAVLAAGPAIADEKADVMEPVRQFVDGFNKGDVKSALAACAGQASIIDDGQRAGRAAASLFVRALRLP